MKIAGLITLVVCAVASPVVPLAQNPPVAQIIAVRAGRMFDPKSGMNLLNHVVLTQGSHGGGFADTDLEKEIDSGRVQDPRLLPVGPILGSELPRKVLMVSGRDARSEPARRRPR